MMRKLRRAYTTWAFEHNIDVYSPPWYLRAINYWLFSPSIYGYLAVKRLADIFTKFARGITGE